MFQTKVVESKHTFYVLQFLFPENRAVHENVEKYGGARQATDDTAIRHMRTECWISKATDTQTV